LLILTHAYFVYLCISNTLCIYVTPNNFSVVHVTALFSSAPPFHKLENPNFCSRSKIKILPGNFCNRFADFLVEI
jgi:hypothetical protein